MSEKQVVLVGIGHTHAHVLNEWRRSPIPGARLVCVSDFPVATYSGMLPGTLTGQYASQSMEIDLVSLAKAARAKLVIEPARSVDLGTQSVRFESSRPVRFDVLSIGIGSTPDTNAVEVSGGSLVSIKPMQTFLMRLYERLRVIARQGGGEVTRVVVAGGGVGGIEVSLCLPAYIRKVVGERPSTLTLVDARSRIGHGLSARALAKVEQLLQKRGVDVFTGKRVERVTDQSVVLDNGARMAADIVVWVTGGVPPPLLASIALTKDPNGFILTRHTLQSTGVPNVFAVGDAGTVEGSHAAKAGVYAVREGPVLFRNIRSMLRGKPLRRYRPQKDFLRLLNTGDGKALLDYKGWAVHARGCWLLKDWIDGRFVSRFRVTRD